MIEFYLCLDALESAALALTACAVAVLLRLAYRVVQEWRATRQLAEAWQRDREERDQFAQVDHYWTQQGRD